MVTFTGFNTTVGELAPFLGKTVLITTVDKDYGSHQAFGVFGSANLPTLPHASSSGTVHFSGAGSISWRRYGTVTIDLLDQTTDVNPTAVVAVDGNTDDDTDTLTVYVLSTDEGFDVSIDPTDEGISYSRQLGIESAISQFVGHPVSTAGINYRGDVIFAGQNWGVFHVTS